MAYKSDFLNVLDERGFIHQCSDFDGLDALAAKREVIGYVGYDCTAPSLHIGNFLSMMMLHWLQETGNKPITLMGGGTTMVGDPSGKDETRAIRTLEEIEANKASIKGVFNKVLRFGDGSTDAIMVDNADWLLKLSYIDMLRDVGRHFSVNRMLTMDSVRLRLEREQEMSLHRVQLHGLPVLRLRGTGQALWVQSADGRFGPVGQYCQWRRSGSPHGHAPALRPDHPTSDHIVGRENGQDRARGGLAKCRTVQRVGISGNTGAIPKTATWRGS